MTPYYRLSGGGNDFLALVEPEAAPAKEAIRAWCRRGISVGADGVFLLDRPGRCVRMRYFNADGRAADLCLNGTRCAARLALELGWIEEPATTFPIETGAGVLVVRAAGDDRIDVELPAPGAPRPCELHAASERWRGWELEVGVPHFVIPIDDGLASMEISHAGPALRYHDHFAPAGANVDWIELEPGGFAIRTWERGVEAETLACGTGVLAAAAASVAAGTLDLPARVRTRGGFPFTVRGETEAGTVRSWSLTGDARIIARGEIYPGAIAEPGA